MDNYITLEHLDQTVWSLIQKNNQLREEISAVDEKVNNINITESDPIFSASPAAHITYNDMDYWDGAVRSSDLNSYMKKGIDYVTAGKKSGTSIGLYATAEGTSTTASGDYSHAEGNNTTASVYCSHAEGNTTIASGTNAHAEGSYTTASGSNSHAEGLSATASGAYSHAEGGYTTAQRAYQHVFGRGNIADTTGSKTTDFGQYIEIVGNNKASNGYSNARTLDWSGNEWLAGKLTVGAGPTNNMDVATKQYVDAAIPTIPTVPTKTSELTNDSGFITSDSDEKLRVEFITTESNTIKYYPIFANDTSTAIQHISETLKFARVETNGIKYSELYLGNSTDHVGALYLCCGRVNSRSVLLTPYVSDTIGNPVDGIRIQLPSTAGTLALTSQLPTKTSQLTNDSGYITSAPVTSVNGKTGAVTLTASDIDVDTSNFLSITGGNGLRLGGNTLPNPEQGSSIDIGGGRIRIQSASASGEVYYQVTLQAGVQQLGFSYAGTNTDNNYVRLRGIRDPQLNYDAATKGYVDTTLTNAISGITSFNALVVAALPTTDIDTHTIYFMSKTGSTNDVYDEYMYINDAWEKIGNTAVDLSGYLKWRIYGTAADNGVQYAYDITDGQEHYYRIPIYSNNITAPNQLTTKDYVDTAISSITLPTKLSDLTNDAGYITSYTETDPVFAASAAAGITSTDISNWNAKVSDDKTWNGVTLNNTTLSGGTLYVPVRAQYNDTQAYNLQATVTPSSQKIAMYSASSYLNSTTPAATDNSTKVATTAYVTTAISNAATTVTQTLTSGTAIATINGTTIYAPSYTDADGVSY